MNELFILLGHLLTTIAELLGPGGVRADATDYSDRRRIVAGYSSSRWWRD